MRAGVDIGYPGFGSSGVCFANSLVFLKGPFIVFLFFFKCVFKNKS